MLRSTGYFRGIDCPFYSGGSDGSSGCNRPYCHFRHSSSSRQRASAGVYKTRKAQDGPSDSNDQGYDPFNPEVVRPGEQYNAEPPASPVMDPGAMELELVNRAIEAVQSEMEKEKKKLSRIGEQGYDPANSSIEAGYSRQAVAATSSHSAYDPGSYQMSQTSEYNPTPRSSKYTLDSESNRSSHANSMEYVPTAVSRATVKKAAPAPTSCVPSTCSTSSKNKYTLDNLKPSTDMEYDPMSNFSAKPGSKAVKDVVMEGDQRKRAHPGWQKQNMEEEYVPVVKKPRQLSVEEPQKYTASFDSDEESSGNEYRPTTMSRLQRRKSSTDSVDDEKRKARETGACRKPPATQEFMAYDDDHDDNDEEFDSFEPLDSEQPDDEPLDKKRPKNSAQVKKVQSEKTVRKDISGSVKKCSSHKDKKGSGDMEKTSRKPSQESGKKKSHGKVVEERVKSKDSEKGGNEVKLKDGKSKKLEKKKGEQGHGDKERNVSEAKKPKLDKVLQSGKESSKYKEQKNGRIESSGREMDKKKSSASSAGSSKNKNKKGTSSALEKKVAKGAKAKPRSLSHVDLFGDESPEEEEDEEDERVVRKSASAFKRGSLLNKRKASDATETSSEDDIRPGDEDEHADRDAGDDDGGDDDDAADDGTAADFSVLQEDLDYDSDPMEECLRIFNESKYVKTEDKGRQAKQPPKEQEDDQDTQSTLTTLFPGQKKRVSHFKAKGSTETSLSVPPRPQRRLTAQEVCYQRMQIAQQQAAQLAASVAKNASTPASGEKRRVMHRPNPALVTAKKPVLPESQQASRGVLSPSRAGPDQSSVKAHTSASMLSKTMSTTSQKRVAHTPTLKSSSMKRPVIPTEFGAKVPTNVRQRYLSVFIDECLKFCPSEEAAFQMALDEEKLVYERSSSKSIYLNVAVNVLKKLRSKSAPPSAPSSPVASLSTKKSPAVSGTRKSQSHEGVLGGRLAATTSYTLNRTGKHQDVQLKGAVLYHKLKAYVLSEEQLQEHGYPRPDPECLGHAIIYNTPEKKNQDPFSKVCCRCGAEYKVNASGNCVRKEECNHHWGRLRRYKVSGGWETQYSCCSGAVGSPGCQVAKQHVQDGRKESLDGYVKTFSKPASADGNAGAYALDCEMCYTKQGLELTRVTVINSDLKVVYDTFVKPESKVVDYNTRFSGVTQEDLESATMRLRDVQAVLLNMFSAESILIGHSLESDLFALKLLHSTVVDTAVVFPHRLGLPYKRALRNIMADHLKRIIQDSAEGHDSSEDAAACMELMIWKIKEDAKVKR